MEQVKYGVPFTVKIKSYILHAVIFAIALITDVFLFQFLAADATVACAELRRINDAPHSEVVISGEAMGDDTFFYLRGQHISGRAEKNVSCDILMVRPGEEYSLNDVYFKGVLDTGECAVSKNLAGEYGLEIGDTVKVIGTDVTFKVTEHLTAQPGLDKEYRHEGVVVLSYDQSLLNKAYYYLSFTTDGDNYPALVNLIFINNWRGECKSTLLTSAAIVVAATALIMLVCERFLFGPRRRDYRVMVSLGKVRGRMFLTLVSENAAKYFLPCVAVGLIYFSVFYGYGLMYILPAACVALVSLVLVAAYSLITLGNLYKCQAKAKK